MNTVLLFGVTCIAAVIFGLAVDHFRITAGAMIGSLVGVALLNLIGIGSYTYPWCAVVLQIICGMMIGSKLGRKEVMALPAMLKPLLLLVVCIVLYNLVFGTMIHVLGGMDIATSLFATTPGGVADMALISKELGADTAVVAILQLIRLLFSVIVCPLLFTRLARRAPKKETSKAKTDGAAYTTEVHRSPIRLILMGICGSSGGLLLRYLGVSGGAIIGSILGSACFCVGTGRVYFPKWLAQALMLLSGAVIGVGITRETLASMPKLIVPILLMMAGILVFVLLVSWVLYRFTEMDYITALCTSAPGGSTEMTLLADSLGGDTAAVGIIHNLRYIFVVATFPMMITAIVMLLG